MLGKRKKINEHYEGEIDRTILTDWIRGPKKRSKRTEFQREREF